MPETIAAIASPPGHAPRAVVRLSGPRTHDVLVSMLGADPGVRSAAPARFRLTETLSLPVLLVRFTNDASYTGEDAAEMLVPGSPALARRVLEQLLSLDGVRVAEPGEFSARAYLAGRLTIEQGEGVARLIAAQTDAQLDAARDLLSGAVGDRFRAWADELAGLLALVEGGIDFTDEEDVTPIDAGRLTARLDALRAAIDAVLGGATPREHRDEAPLVVLVGAPNAGKSTLFNALLARPRALVSAHAGTTRDALVEDLDLSRDAPDAGIVRLADLPGLDAGAAGVIDAAAQHAARETIARADALVHCDPSGRFAAIDAARPNATVIRVRTKADLPAPGVPPPGALAVCALDGRRLGALRRAIADIYVVGAGSDLVPRHHAALSRASRSLREASPLARSGAPDPAPTAQAMRDALDALGELVGRIDPDDVIGRIFATFCVGK